MTEGSSQTGATKVLVTKIEKGTPLTLETSKVVHIPIFISKGRIISLEDEQNRGTFRNRKTFYENLI